MYADYSFYTDTYGSKVIEENKWPAAERKARAYIDLVTFHRLVNESDVPEAVKLALCAAADVDYSEAHNDVSHKVKSFNNGGYSETLYTPEETAKFYVEKRAREVNLYLPRSHPLRYAGV